MTQVHHLNMLDNDLEHLLSDELSCSQAFLTRVDDLEITSTLNLMENILDSDNGSQPDMCNLLCLFHDDLDVMDPLTGQHEFKDEVINLFHMKKAWTNRPSPDSFDCKEHFNSHAFHQSLKKAHRRNNLCFKCGLAAFHEELEGYKEAEE